MQREEAQAPGIEGDAANPLRLRPSGAATEAEPRGGSGASAGVIAGAAIGAVGGWLAGSSKGHPARALTGAVIGGLAGAGLGYVAEVRRQYGLTLQQFARAAGIGVRTL